MPPIEATEKNPVRVCSEPSAGERSWIDFAADTASMRDCGVGSVAVWKGASTQVQFVETIVAAPTSAEKLKAKLSISPTSSGSNGVARRIAGLLTQEDARLAGADRQAWRLDQDSTARRHSRQ